MRVLSLFSGIGGMDKGLEDAGMSVVAHSEIDPYACRVLRKHWPDVPNLRDITKITEADVEQLGQIDVVAGGVPCQPISKGGGQRGELDERWLWPEFWRVVRMVRPRYVLAENPTAILARPEWMGAVLGGAAACGFLRRVEWDCIPAASIGSPHQRDRVFFVAHADHDKAALRGDGARSPSTGTSWRADGTTGPGLAREVGVGGAGQDPSGARILRRPNRRSFWTDNPIPDVVDGAPAGMGELRGLGNAVLPQVAEHVGRCIMEHAS